MTNAPFNAYMVIGVVDHGEEIGPLGFLTNRAGGEEDAKTIAMGVWRLSYPTQRIGGIQVHGFDWAPMAVGEVSRCVS